MKMKKDYSCNVSALKLVKRLLLKLKQTNDFRYFEEILVVVDKLLLFVVINARKKNSYLHGIELKDLYNTAIVALFKVVKKIPDDEQPLKISAWISSYVKSEIKQQFKCFQKDNQVSIKDIEDIECSKLHSNCLSVDPCDFLKYAKKVGVLSKDQYKTLWNVYVDGNSIESLAKMMKIKTKTLYRRIEVSKKKIKDFLKLMVFF